MKLVTAILQPEKFQDIRQALEEFGIKGMTVSEAQGYGQQGGHVEVYRGKEYQVNLLPKVRLEILTDDSQALDMVDLIIATANTGSAGDGKIWVTTVDEAIRVRTGERGEAAL
ncbi:P-II family nitrogen regulator [Rothia aerolata]|uniref:Nitrogen regulatory protein P-II 1 n=1 Tax=Rothia aerolata TaxID=1812262 RepID=A0A917MRD5_9MICC|nr:P-II family nitrogen regulator [Rothia aerolata]GGH58672.1 nitrogen regulatory protein P-II 1 [Rothia aerolata]